MTRRCGVLLDAMRQAEQREAFRESLDLLSELVDILPPTDRRWLDVLEAMYWQAEWVVDHRAETRTETAVRALRAIDGLLADSPDDAQARDGQVPSGQLPGMGDRRAAGGREQTCREAIRLYEAAGAQRQALLGPPGDRLDQVTCAATSTGMTGGVGAGGRGAAEATGRPVRHDARASRVRLQHASMRARFADAESAIRRAVAIAERGREGLPADHGIEPARSRSLPCRAAARESLRYSSRPGRLNPAFRDTILIELETFVHWMAGEFPRRGGHCT